MVAGGGVDSEVMVRIPGSVAMMLVVVVEKDAGLGIGEPKKAEVVAAEEVLKRPRMVQ